MGVVASVHVADVGPLRALRLIRSVPTPGSIDGLRHANLAVAQPLRSGRGLPSLNAGRVGFIGFWDDDAALERFLDGDPLAASFRTGWHARLEPLRAFGNWPGLPDDIARERTTSYAGPAVVLTLGRVRFHRVPQFLRTSKRAEVAAHEAHGMLWGTALARPPFVATCSLWQSTKDLATYAFGRRYPGHPAAIEADRANPFHHQSAFVRFRPYAVAGSLGGTNPLPAGVVEGTVREKELHRGQQ